MLSGNCWGARLFYVWCNVDCLAAANWQGIDLGLGQSNGQGPDLVLDAAGQPQLAYALYEVGGIGYSRCTGNGAFCEEAGGHDAGDRLELAT